MVPLLLHLVLLKIIFLSHRKKQRFVPLKNIQEAGYVYTDNVIKVPWKSVINWELIEQLISFNIEDKKVMINFGDKALYE